MPFTLTAEHLRKVRKACEPQVLVFEATFPRGMEWTRENLLRCAEAGLDVEWYARTGFRGDILERVRAAAKDLQDNLEAEREKVRHVTENLKLFPGRLGEGARMTAAVAQFEAATAPAKRAFMEAVALAMFDQDPEHDERSEAPSPDVSEEDRIRVPAPLPAAPPAAPAPGAPPVRGSGRAR